MGDRGIKTYRIKDLLTGFELSDVRADNSTSAVKVFFKRIELEGKPIRPRVQRKLKTPFDTRFEGEDIFTGKSFAFNRDGFGFDKESGTEYFIGKMLSR